MAEYRYYLIPDFMSHVFPQQFEEQAPTEFFSNTADLMKRYKQLREMPYNNEYTWNERTNLPYPRLTVGIDRRDPDGAVTIMQVRNGVNYNRDAAHSSALYVLSTLLSIMTMPLMIGLFDMLV